MYHQKEAVTATNAYDERKSTADESAQTPSSDTKVNAYDERELPADESTQKPGFDADGLVAATPVDSSEE